MFGIFQIFAFISTSILMAKSDITLSCDDSIDISSGSFNFNRSISFDGKLYEYGLYSMVDYVIENDQKKNVTPYARACIYKDRLPCKFSESINITKGTIDQNGLIKFNYMDFPNGTYAKISYNYQIISKEEQNDKNETIYRNYFERGDTAEYLRGCVCNRMPCIRFCCSKPNQIYVKGRCLDGSQTNLDLPIKIKDGNVSSSNFKDHFYYVTGQYCGKMNSTRSNFYIQDVRFISIIFN